MSERLIVMSPAGLVAAGIIGLLAGFWLMAPIDKVGSALTAIAIALNLFAIREDMTRRLADGEYRRFGLFWRRHMP